MELCNIHPSRPGFGTVAGGSAYAGIVSNEAAGKVGMAQIAIDSDITLYSRFECKYLVSPEIVPVMREFLQPFMAPDRYAAKWEGNRYPICSLYFDTADLALYQQTVRGNKNRFKLRIRTYDDDPRSLVFFEVKRRINNIVQKRRAPISREATDRLLHEGAGDWIHDLECASLDDLEEFVTHVELSGAKPVVRVRYLREAYESRGGDPLRVTIDTDLMHAVTFNHNLAHEGGRWVSTPVAGSIIEIKFTERFPTWVNDMVRTFGLKQQPVPKYVMSIDHILLEGRASALQINGFLLPPRTA